MFKIIKERFSKRKRLAKKQPQVLRYEELEQRVLFSADVVPGLDTAAVEEQVIAQDVTSEVQVEREAAPETVEQTAEEARSELVLVNENVTDYEQLIADLQGSDNNRIIEVVVLESDRDGIEQVSDILSERSDLAALHVISHGSDGQINLGDSWLNSTTLQQNSDAVAGWGNALAETGDILIYGCNLAASEVGQSLIADLSALTLTDVAASDDVTGHASLGGDWELEHAAGTIEAEVALSESVQQQWNEALDISSDLQAHLTFDAGQDAQDSSVNNRDGTLEDNAAVDTTPATNQIGDGKLILDGADDYVNLNAHAAGMAGFTEGTISAWIKTSATSQQMIFNLGNTGASDFVSLQTTSSGKLQWWVSEGTTQVDVSSNSSYNDGNWHHVAVTVGPSGNTLWADGVELTSGQVTYSNGSAASTNFFDDLAGVARAEVGAYEYSGTMYDEFSGLIDDFRIYDRALTASDVSELYSYNGNALPVITSNGGGPTANVNVAENTTAVTTVTATDPDLDTPTFSITGGVDAAQFDIDTNSGVLAFKQAPDFENPTDSDTDNVYVVEVTADDGNSGTDVQTISVTVTDDNDDPLFIEGGVGYWQFDEGTGITTDDSAYGTSTGTLVNDPTWTTGQFDQALQFDGVNDYVEIADAPELDISGPEFSASLWIKPDSGPNVEDMLFMKGDRQGNVNYYLSWKNSGKMTWAFKDGADFDYIDMGVTLPTVGEWNHVAIVFSRPTVSLYINGTEYTYDNIATGGSMDRDLTANDEVLWIGAGRSGGSLVGVNQYSGPFHGAIDELAIYNRALTAAEVEAIRTSQPAAATANTFGIVENRPNGTVVGTVAASDQDVGDTLSYAITAGNTGGAFSIDANGQIKVANSTALDFETNPTFNLTIEATDDGSPNLSDTMTVTITLANVNDAPEGANNTVSTNEDTDYVFDTNDFGFTDPNDSPADNFANVIITTTVVNGTLYVDANGNGIVDGGEALSDLDTVSVVDISAGCLKFKPAANANGTNYDSFAFQVVDDGGGTDTDLTANTMTINVTAVNDAAPVAGDDAYTVNEDNTLTADWWNTNWTRRQQLTFDNLAQPETLTDFPVLVILNSGNIDYTQTKDDGSDLRFFSADGTQLVFEIEQWNEGGDSSVWVRIPQITGNSNSDSIWMYYGNATAQPITDAANVWDSNFVGVWHLNQEQSGTGNVGVYKDSTGTGNNGIDRTAATGQDGQVTDGQEFGTSDWIEIAHDPSLDLKDSMTISFWIKPTSDSGTFNRVVEKGLWGYQDSYYFGGGNGTNDLTFYLNNQEVFDTADNVLTIGDWQHCTVSYTSNGDGTGSARLYINGVEVDINGDPAGVAAPPIGTYNGGMVAGNTGRLAIGHENSSYDFDGFIDEVQISNTDRSADWIAAQYQATKNQFGAEFVKFGGEESAPAVGGVLDNDSDVDNDPLTVTLVDGPDNAQSFTLNKDGTFIYTPTANYHGNDTFTYEVNDGNSGTTQATATITVNPINDAPDFSLTLDGTPTFTEDGPAVVLDSNVAIFDAELSAADNFDGATLTLVRNGGAESDDIFSVTGTLSALTEGGGLVIGGTTIGTVTTNSGGTLVLTLNANATNALVNSAMQQIAYSNSSDTPPASVQIDWSFDDGNTGSQGAGGALQANGGITVNITAANDAPTMTAWFNDAWDSRKSLIINAASVAGDLTGFPVLITLNTDPDLAAQALSNGDDILFTAADGTTQLAHEIEYFDDTTGELRVWVKTDLSASADTNILMYFGNDTASNQENIPGVWNNYVGVYHLSESPTGAPSELVDSSGSGNHATTEGSMDAADSVATTIGQGLAFDGSDDMIRITDSVSLDSINDAATFSLWINFVDAADGDTQIIMSSSNRYNGWDGYEWAQQNDGDHFFYPDAMMPDTNYNLGANPFTNGDWHHLAATMDFATKEVKVYVDGTSMSFSYEGVPGSWTSLTSSDDLLWGGNPDRATRYFLGMMDEIRIADVVRSQEWIQTEVNNQSAPGTFFTLGITEDRQDKLTNINEDDFNSPGDTVLSIINSSGADRIMDSDTGALEGIAIIAVDDTNGEWQYDANADGSWVAIGAVSDTNAVLLDTSALIRFVPDADYNGSAGDLIFHAWDQTSGANGNTGIDISTNGGNTAFSSEDFVASLNVNPVNDAPVLGGIGNQTVDELATLTFTVTATDVDIPADTLTFSLDVASIALGMSIDANTGVFSWTPTELQGGITPSVTVTVTDNGTGNLVDSETFTITVNDINVAPIDLQATQTVNGGLCVNENGGNDLYLVADDGGTLLGGLTTVTVESSFSITTPAGDVTPLLSYADGTNDEELGLFIKNDGRIWFMVHSQGAPYQSTTGSYAQLFDGEVHHVGVSWDASNGAVAFYVDGQEVESFTGYQAGQTINGGGELVFGQDQDSVLGGFVTTDVFSGTLYDVRIFNDVRTAPEIAANYDQTLPNTEPGMIANWTFNDLSTGVVLDTVSGNNLTEQHVSGPGFNASTPELTLEVWEDALDGTVIGSLTAVDPDNGDTFTYTLLDDAGGRFSINASNGQITLVDSALLDFESATSHNITTRVTDSGGLTYDEVFTINVLDANEFAPVANDATVGIDEDAANGTSVHSVVATDQDATANLTYSFISGNADGVFTIDANTGEITIADNTNLDRETTASYVLTVQVSDGTNTDNATITVNVGDINEFVPVANDTTVAINEDAANGTSVHSVVATDSDATANLTYSIIGGNADGVFSIDANTGEITIADNTNLDRETTASYGLTVQVSDGTNTDNATITVNVGDINEFAPVANDATVGINEDAANGTSVHSVVATDQDATANLTYSIIGGNADGVFTIDANTGEITIADNTNLDRETTASYGLTVEVSDGTNTDNATITVNVGDINEFAPVANDATVGINEDAANGTSVHSVVATDQDATANLTYSIIGGNADGVFTIDANTGEITIADNTNLDRETTASYGLTIQVSDGTNTDNAMITVNIGDVDEFDVGSVTDFDVAANTVAEDAVVGATVGVTALADDADATDNVIYSLSDNAGGRFTIDANTGVITVNGALDYETNTSHSVTVLATSDDGSTSSQAFTIDVTDVSESGVGPVSDTDGAADAVDEDALVGATVGVTANAVDPDAGDTVTYSLDDDAGGLFTIDANTGVVTLAGALDAENAASHSITIRATSSDTSFSTTTLSIAVNDINEFVPVANDATVGINEDAANGTSVHSVVATDADATANLTYSIIGGNADGVFTIEANTGEITIADNTNLDRETTASYDLTLQVSDGTNADNATITVNVGDINEFAPVANDATVAINEDAANGTSVHSVVATDQDATANLTYSIIGGNADGVFTIDANTGEITIADNTNLDRETTASYGLTVQVSDGTNTDTAAITVNIGDVDEFDVGPVTDSDVAANTVAEDAVVGTTVGVTALADDADATDNVTYSLSDDAGGRFAIDANTGVITVNGALDYETNTSHSVTVLATSDDGSTSSQVFTINVTDVNEAPTINDATLNVDENAPNGTGVGNVPGTDPDSGDTHVYTITAGNTNGAFAIDNAGNITVANSAALNFETTPVFTLTVQIQDQGGTGLTDTATITINLNNLNEAPTSSGIANVTVGEDAPNTVIDLFAAFANTEDPDASLIYTITANTNPGLFAANSIDGVAGTLTLDYAPNAYGTANITVRATDTSALWVEDTFTVTVNPVNDAPSTTPVNLTAISEDSGGRLITQAELLANATDVDGPALTATNLAISAGSGTLVDNGDGTWNYTSAANDDTSVSFTYTVTDGNLTTTGNANLDITPVNDEPVINNDSASVDEGQNVVINLVGNDADVDNALDLSSITITAAPTNGNLVDNGDGTLTYTHDGSKTIRDSFSYTINDVSGASSNIAAVSLTINPDNDNDPSDSTDPDPILLVDLVTDEDEDSDVESPIYEAPAEDPLTENEVLSPVEAIQTPEYSGDTDASIVEIKDSQDEESQDIIYLTDEIDRNAQPEGREDDRGYTYYDNDLYKDMSSLKYWNLIDNAAQSGPVAVNLDDINFHDFDSEDNDPVIIDENYDALRQEIDESFDTELKGQSIKAKIVTATAATFTVGIVSYLLRAGSLVASMMSALPLWRGFDPIAIFSGDKKKKKKQDEISDTGELKPESFFDGDAE